LYYSGLMMAQIDRPDVTFRIWQQLLRNGPEDAPWLDPVRQQIPEIAFLAGQNDFELPETGLKGPNAEDINNAATLSEGDRMDMIQGMVSQLSDRLATQGGSPAEWARLINALGVLGDTDQARNIFANAQEVFGADAAALSQITAAAKQIGIVE
jgi:cytochrome c-type biogenesis protein CcmH